MVEDLVPRPDSVAILKEKLQRLASCQEILAKNYRLLQERNCDQEFLAFTQVHLDLLHKHDELKTHAGEVEHRLEEKQLELTRSERKIQSQAAHIRRLSEHNQRANSRLNELQRCFQQIKGTLNGHQDAHQLDQLQNILRDSLMSDSETTDISDKNCTGEELDSEERQLNMPKVVSQSGGLGHGVKRSSPLPPLLPSTTATTTVANGYGKRARHDEDILGSPSKPPPYGRTTPSSGGGGKNRIVATTKMIVDVDELMERTGGGHGPVTITSEIHHHTVEDGGNAEGEHHTATATLADHLLNNHSPYSNILVEKKPRLSVTRPVPAKIKPKVRKPSREFLKNKSEESEMSTDDTFWTQGDDEEEMEEAVSLRPPPPSAPVLYPTLTKIAAVTHSSPAPSSGSSNVSSPLQQQRTLTPGSPYVNGAARGGQHRTPNTGAPPMLGSGSGSAGTMARARAHNFVSRSVMLPETCCVCLKKIHFGKLAYRCTTCTALCHIQCKDGCGTLCLPHVKTPARGAIDKFSPKEGLQVPAILVHCIKEIERRGLQELGLYRLSVAEGQVKLLKEKILKSRTGMPDLSHTSDVHIICGVVKDFLRSLSESLLTSALWKSFAQVMDDGEESDESKRQRIDSLLHQLPKSNRDTLAFVLLHLQRVAQSPATRMPVLNLSRALAPAVIGYSSKTLTGIDIVAETYKETKILEFFLAKMPSDYWAQWIAPYYGGEDGTEDGQQPPIPRYAPTTPTKPQRVQHLLPSHQLHNGGSGSPGGANTGFFSPL